MQRALETGRIETVNMEQTALEADGLLRRRRREGLVQNLGLAAFLLGIALASLSVGLSDGDSQAAYLVMFFASCAGIWLAAYRFRYIALIFGGLQVLLYTVYKLYGAIAGGRALVLMDYVWLVLPLFCISAMILFMRNMYRVEQMAELLSERIQSMEVIEPVTGLSNLRSMYIDLERQMAYAQRNNVELTLIIFELRYYQELKSILSAEQFAALRRRMASLVEETLRMEDRVYAIDDRGSLGISCIGCGGDGAITVKNRIAATLSQPESFSGILDRRLRVDVRVGSYTYNRDEVQNAMEFKQKVENELQYDV